MRLLILFIFFSFVVLGQNQVLVLGNHTRLCFKGEHQFILKDSLPAKLDAYDAIMLFSGSTSNLSSDDVNRIVEFVEIGGGLYSGAENWPLQSESNQITNYLYRKESFGKYDKSAAECAGEDGNLMLKKTDSIPAGSSIVAFPMDYRLTVEAWVEDQPLILSGKIKSGRIIIDGGYSRFYCDQRNSHSDELLKAFLRFLL